MSQRANDWRDHANCKGQDPELFFPEKGEKRRTKIAKTFCEPCPVKARCLEFALETDSVGVFGGTTTRERASMQAYLHTPRKNRHLRNPLSSPNHEAEIDNGLDPDRIKLDLQNVF
jgi:WhiB family redox-sensing transcriptional regulator